MSLKMTLAAFAAAVFFSSSAFATKVLGPVSASSNVAGSGSPAWLISLDNGRGLAPSPAFGPAYVSGVTDYQPYIAQNPVHAIPSTANGFSYTGAAALIDFDLGGLFSLTNLALWNGSENANGVIDGINEFTVLVDDNAAFSSPENAGTFNATSVARNVLIPVESFDFSKAIDGSHVRLQVNSSHGRGFSLLSQVAFGGMIPTVAEPGTVALLLVGISGLGAWRRRPTS